MSRALKKFIMLLTAVTLIALVWKSMDLSHSNDVYSFLTTASTPLTGYRLAVVSSSPIWAIGSAQHKLAVEECRYWTDSSGRAIPWWANRVKPGDKQHRYTRFQLGQVLISLPLPPMALAFLAGFIVPALAWFLITRFGDGRSPSTV
jgi:hypothetical protein